MLAELKACADRKDLAVLLGYKPKNLSYILYKVPDEVKYTTFLQLKKDGGERVISSPIPKLKLLQTKVSNTLQDCIADIQQSDPGFLGSSFAFSRGLGIWDNAKLHRGRRHVFNIDIKDFFSSINIGRIIGFFKTDRRFELSNEVAVTLAQICCHESVLPQGAPSSPVVANLIGSLLDARLARFAARNRCRYSRYADDITFSTNTSSFPISVAAQDESEQGWAIGPELLERLTRSGFTPNPSKTRMSVRQSRQIVTGLVVNERVRVPAEYYKTTRAMCHHALTGKLPHHRRFFDEADKSEMVSLDVVEGRLSHIYNINCRDDDRSSQEIQESPSAIQAIYRDFLRLRTFYRAERPLIITEGPSDVIYIEEAASRLAKDDPAFFSQALPARRTFAVYRYPKRAGALTGLSGGTGNLTKTLVQLRDFGRKYSHLTPINPVIILVDNDKAGLDVTKAARGVYASTLDETSMPQYMRLRYGLYVLPVPLSGKETADIEDLLPTRLLNLKLGGKSFSSSNNLDATKHFGKVALAEYVRKNANSISFVGFQPLLDAIRAIWTDWHSSSLDWSGADETAYLLSRSSNATRLQGSVRQLDKGRGTERELATP